MSQNHPSIQDLFIPKIGRASKYLGMLMDNRLSQTELTLKQFILLTHVKDEAKAQSDLVLITERNKSSLTRLIQSMERKQLVKRRNSKTDKRINIVESTPFGRKALKRAEKIVLMTFEEMKTDISKKEELAVIAIADKLMANAQKLLDLPKRKS